MWYLPVCLLLALLLAAAPAPARSGSVDLQSVGLTLNGVGKPVVYPLLRDGKPLPEPIVDVRQAQQGVELTTPVFPAVPGRTYRYGGLFTRLGGESDFLYSIEWLDAERKHLGYEWIWMGRLIGTDPEPYLSVSTAPWNARFMRLFLHIPPGRGMRLADMYCELMPLSPPRIAIDLLPQAAAAGEPFDVVLRAENRGDGAHVTGDVQLILPKGLSAAETRWTQIPLASGQVFRKTVRVQGKPLNDGMIRCVVVTDANGVVHRHTGSTRLFTTVASPLEVDGRDLQPPAAPYSAYRLGAYYFPVMLDWDRSGWGVRKVDYLRPLLGYYDESLPEVADWHIAWAVSHGVSWFAFDWYHNQGLDYLNDALEKGFLKSRFSQQMQFCIDWCNEGHCTEFRPLDFGPETLRRVTRVWCERYFNQPNYLRITGRPVVFIHVPIAVVNANGGWDGCRMALEGMRDVARSYGHDGMYIVAVHSNTPYIADYQKGGFDAVAPYAYGFRDVPRPGNGRSLPFEALLPRHGDCFTEALQQCRQRGLGYIPAAWVGWDDAARSNQQSIRTEGNTPAAFRRMIERLESGVDPNLRLALVEAWNEWGEGGAIEPEHDLGFGRLAAIRDVLTDARGPYSPPAPNPASVRRYHTDITWDQVNDMYYDRYARKLGLERGLDMRFTDIHDLWLRPVQHLRFEGMGDGAIRYDITGSDPQMVTPPSLRIPAASVQSVRIRCELPADGELQLFWNTVNDRGWSETRSIKCPLAGGSPVDIDIPVGDHPEWRGDIWQMRIDPGSATGRVRIERLTTVMRNTP